MTIRVAQITDMHLTANPGSKLYGVDTAQSLKNVIKEIRKLPKIPDVIIATGDIAEDGSKITYRHLQDLLAELKLPVCVLPGNHDDMSEMRSSFYVDGYHCTTAMRFHDWGFIFVNSQVEGQSHGYVSFSEFTELERNISALEGHPILIALHHTPSNICPSLGCQLKNSKEFTAFLNKYPNVKGVIAVHTHNTFKINAGGHVQFTTPSTFAHVTHAQLGETVDHNDFWASHRPDGSLQGFRVLDLFPEGVIQSEVHWMRTER